MDRRMSAQLPLAQHRRVGPLEQDGQDGRGSAGLAPLPSRKGAHDMKMGFITSLLDGWTYEEMIDEVSRLGIECVEGRKDLRLCQLIGRRSLEGI